MKKARTPLVLTLVVAFLANAATVASPTETSASTYRAGEPQPFPEHAAPAGERMAAERVRELTDLRGLNAKSYELADGRIETEVAASPVHYRDGKGKLQNIDLSVGTVDEPGFAKGNKTNSFTTLFGAKSDRLTRVELGSRHVELGLLGAAKDLSPVVEGSTVTYADAIAGADLVYEVTPDELKESIVLDEPPTGDASYTFTLRVGGVEAAEQADGSVAFLRRGSGEPVFRIPAPFMYDSRDDAESPYGKSWSDQVTQTVEQRGATTTITLAADAGWLRAPEREYPVVIDPTVEIEPIPETGQDTRIYSGSPTTNFGSSWPLSVGTTSSAVYRSLLKFPLTGIPAGTQLDSAQLKVYYDQSHTTSANDVPIEARRVTASWSESTATWNSINASLAEVGQNQEIVDNSDTAKVTVSGSWPASGSSNTQYAVNQNYQYNQNATAGESFTWKPRLTEAGDYKVDVHYVPDTNRSTAASYTAHYNGGSKAYSVNQNGTPAGVWTTLGTHPFVAGTTHKVVLSDATVTASTAVIADAVRFTKFATQTKKIFITSVWHTFSVRSIAQQWLNGTAPNHGFMLKATSETLGKGGPMYEASEHSYGGETDTRPKLVLTWGRPGVALAPPTTVTGTGAHLSWSAYQDPSTATGDDILEYQVHRSQSQVWTPGPSTLVAPVAPGSTTFVDTTAEPTPADDPDPTGRAYYYMVAVKTKDGQVIPSPTKFIRLPKAGRVMRIFQTGTIDTTLSAAKPDVNVDVYDGDPFISAGNNSTVYGDSRAIVKFPSLTGIPAGARIVDAELRLWTTFSIGTTFGNVFDVHALTRSFTETQATWNRASSATPWTTPGGDFNATLADTVSGVTNDPEVQKWTVSGIVQGWLNTPTTNHGLLVKIRDEAASNQRVTFLSSEAAEPELRPKLMVTYLEKDAASTYYAPDTPDVADTSTEQAVTVTVTNTTTQDLNAADYALSYHWALPDGTDITTAGNRLDTALPQDLSPGESVTVPARLMTPAVSTPGNKREAMIPRWDLRHKTTGQWLSQTQAIPPLDQNVAVQDLTSDELGLEDFFQYTGQSTGAGSSVLANLHSGNMVYSYDALSIPSRGPETFVRLTYNSLDTSDTPAGYGWSLSASTLPRLGTPLEFHPPGQDWPTTIKLTDGDGTTHTFTLNKHGSTDPGVWDYDHPAGVHLYLQKTVGADTSRAWVMTSPDRTKFYFDDEGFQSTIVDNNGNELSSTYEQRKSNNKPTKFLRYLTDATERRTLTVDYYEKGENYSYIDDSGQKVNATNLANPKIIEKVQTVTDLSGRTLAFTYTVKGLLAELIDGAGSPLAKMFRYDYHATQGNKNVKLVKVTDPRGSATNLAYYDLPEDDPKFHWWAKTITDRAAKATSVAYADPDGPQGDQVRTTVTDANSHAGTYLMDGFGRPVEATNAKSELTTLGWDGDHNVTRLEEANGAVTTWTYDPQTGYPLTIKDAEANENGTAGTTLTYQTSMNGFVADLTEKVSPEGRKWAFGYDTLGNLTSVVDPAGTATPTAEDFTTTYAYDGFGQLLIATDANGHPTSYGDYHDSGYPETITDALTNTTDFTYDVRGNVLTVTDARDKISTYGYDVFGRPGESRVPKDQDAAQFIVTPAPVYDGNDNVTTATAPNGAVTTYAYDAVDRPTSSTLPTDTPTGPERRTVYSYDNVGNLAAVTEPNGTLTATDPDDFVTRYVYDPIDQLTSVTNAEDDVITYVYDNVGNLVKVVDRRKNATPDPDDFTATYAYDRAHRPQTVTDAAGHTETTTYDRDGLVTSATDRQGATTLLTLDARGMVAEVKAPHVDDGGTIIYRVTKYEYDQVGNQTKVITPRGVETGGDSADFVQQTVYDELNRVVEQLLPFDPDDPRFNAADKVTYGYDAVGNLATVSAPPSEGQSVRNDTSYAHFDNGWIETSIDPWDILASYDYNPLGQQTARTLTSAGGSSGRTMSWAYLPDGKLASRGDDGVPVGKHVVLVDNSDTQNVATTGSWPASTGSSGFQGHNYQTNAAGTGADTFSWNLRVPQDGTYEVFVRYPSVAGAASNASFMVTHAGGSTAKSVNQTTNTGQWVSLGSFAFTETGPGQKITLTDQAGGTVVADAVKLVRDNSGETDTEGKTFTYSYDPNGNLVEITDGSSEAAVDTYLVGYDGLNRVSSVQEKNGSLVEATTAYTYDANGNPLTRGHDAQDAAYGYDVRDLLSTVSVTEPGQAAKVTSYGYTANGWTARQMKANGNTVDFAYFLDGLLKSQVEQKPGGTLVAEHTLAYSANGHKTSDVSRVMDADNHTDYLDVTTAYVYDPRDRIASVSKTDTSSGGTVGSESYTHDANGNVVTQTIDGVTTSFVYDRNRLLSSTSGGTTGGYNYDPFGRLDTVTAAGQVLEGYRYDGFDRVTEHRQLQPDESTDTTRYAFDPLDRTAARTEDAGGAGEETTEFAYLGLSDQLITETIGGQLHRSYQYSPWGQRLSQVKQEGASTEDSFYGYSPHTDVETLTTTAGDTQATYGYTAYGSDDLDGFTGLDAPGDPDAEPYNLYRYTAKRFDPSSGDYDMGFRDYNPGLNRFLSRDTYTGALADLNLAASPWTGNRYTLAGGNPITGIEVDGHAYEGQPGWQCQWCNDDYTAQEKSQIIAGLTAEDQEVRDATIDYVNHRTASTIPGWGQRTPALWEQVATIAFSFTLLPSIADTAYSCSQADALFCAAGLLPGPNPLSVPKHLDQSQPIIQRSDELTAARNACSFTGDTLVVMADGTTKPISQIEVGDHVLATDPETGEQAAKKVTHTWVHQDTVVDLDVDGQLVTTTEDHPFWNATDREWQPAEDLDHGDSLVAVDGERLRVGGLVTASERTATAYNLAVDEFHTYFVEVGEGTVLVHNQCNSPLRLLHGEDTIKISNKSSYDYWTNQSTDDIVISLRPGAIQPLAATAEGTIMQGNTRVYVLMQRGFDVNTLPRTPYQPGPLPDAFG